MSRLRALGWLPPRVDGPNGGLGGGSDDEQDGLLPWLVVGLGLLSLYGPTLWDMLHGSWDNRRQGLDLFLLCATTALLARAWPTLLALPRDRSQARPAYLVILISAGFYALGRSQDIPSFEVGSMVFMVTGCTLLLRGWAGVRLHRFTLPFMMLLVPWPVELVDQLTPLLQGLMCRSASVGLKVLGETGSCQGSALWLNGRELLWAHICPGKPTLLSLLAGLLLYLHLVRCRQRRTCLLLLALSPLLMLIAGTSRPLLAGWVSARSDLPTALMTTLANVAPYGLGLLLLLAVDLTLQRLPARALTGGRLAQAGTGRDGAAP
ncbi:MAG: hypothetical protein RIQ60_2280 [Pseudomonadota bacterium]